MWYSERREAAVEKMKRSQGLEAVLNISSSSQVVGASRGRGTSTQNNL